MCIISSSYVNSNWSYSPETVKLGFDLCDLNLWPLTMTFFMDLTLVIGNNDKILWWYDDGNIVKKVGQTDRWTERRRDGETDNTICRAAWSQLKTYRLKTFADLRRRWRSCVTRIGHTAAADAPVDSCIQLSHLYASVPPVSFCCSWISWSSRNFRQRSWLHCGSYWSG